MAGDDYKDKFEILKVIEANNIVAVFINPPYREFLNVIFYKLINGKGKRIIEGLTIGITDTKSDFLDLHTKGQGIDLTSEPTGNYDFDSNDIQKIIRVLKANNSPIIVYSNFVHTHPLPGIKGLYTIDKTKFLNIAQNIFGKDVWQKYPTTVCTMYDIPKIVTMNFEFAKNTYIVTAETDNNQKWRITFTDADKSNEFLVNKNIEVK